jgi:phosphoglycerate kinase
MLENVRFEPGEEQNDDALAGQLASFADVYVNDAFGAAHRAHASTAGVAKHLPAVAGLLMEKEIDYLGRVVHDPQRPVAAVIGGAKISSKIGVLKHLLAKVDVLVIGGGMASTFLKAQGRAVGESLVEDDQLETAREIMREAERRDVSLGLPVDVVLGERFAEDTAAKNADAADIPDGWMILDIGQVTVEDYKMRLRPAKTIVWNGPMGVAEWEKFAHGSRALAEFLGGIGATVIIGGGETVALVQEMGIADQFAHVSTGGGASLEFLEGKELPGVAALLDR